MIFDDALMWEIIRFLWTCPNRTEPHRYRMQNIREVQENIIDALATGQYILMRTPTGEIEHFMAYWRATEDDIRMMAEDNIEPADRISGDKIFIVEHGNKGGRQSLTRMIKEIKRIATGNKGVAWRNHNRGNFRMFLDKKGDDYVG